MLLSLIFAYAQDSKGRKVIGADNKIPWRSPADMRWFKEQTSGCPVIMGRKTHESIGRLLPNRDNIIVTRNQGYAVEGATMAESIEVALDYARRLEKTEIFVIGGAEIYAQTLDLADRIYITEIKQSGVEGDTFFPKLDLDKFRVLFSEATGAETFRIYQRNVGNVFQSQQDPEASMDQIWGVD